MSLLETQYDPKWKDGICVGKKCVGSSLDPMGH